MTATITKTALDYWTACGWMRGRGPRPLNGYEAGLQNIARMAEQDSSDAVKRACERRINQEAQAATPCDVG